MKIICFILFFFFIIAAKSQEIAWHNPNMRKEIIQPTLSESGLTFAFIKSNDPPSIRVIDTQTGELRREVSIFENSLIRSSICLADDNTLMYATSNELTIVSIELSTGTKTIRAVPHYIHHIETLSADQFIVRISAGEKKRFVKYSFTEDKFSEGYGEAPDQHTPLNLIHDKSKMLTFDYYPYPETRYGFKVFNTTTMELIFESEKDLKMTPHSSIGINSGMLLLGSRMIDTILNGKQGFHFFTEVIEYNEDYEIINQSLNPGRYYTFAGVKSDNVVYLYQTELHHSSEGTIYTYNLSNGTFTEFMKVNISKHLGFRDGKIYGLELGKLKARDKNYQEFSKIPIFGGNSHNSEITGLADLDGKSIITGSRFGLIKRWDISTGEFLENYLDIEEEILNISTSHDKTMLAVCTKSNFQLFKGKSLLEKIPLNIVNTCRFSDDDKTIIIGSQDDDLLVYDIDNREVKNNFDFSGIIFSCEFLDESRVAVGHKRSITVYDIIKGEKVHSQMLYDGGGFDNASGKIELSPDRSKLAVCAFWETLFVFDPTDMKEISQIYDDKIYDTYSKALFTGAAWTSDSENLLLHSQNRMALVNIETSEIYFSRNDMGGNALSNEDWYTNALVSDGDKYLIYTTRYGQMVAFLNPLVKTSVNEKNQLFNIYPNPATASIRLDGNFEGYNFELIDMQGRTMNSGQLQNNSIPLQDLPAGSYLLRLSNGSDLRIQKVMKE